MEYEKREFLDPQTGTVYAGMVPAGSPPVPGERIRPLPIRLEAVSQAQAEEITRLREMLRGLAELTDKGAHYLRAANALIMDQADGDEDDARDCSLLVQEMLDAAKAARGACT